jgi:transposase
MSLKPSDPQRSFYHSSTLCGELFGPTDRYRLFREKVLPVLFGLRAELNSFYCEGKGRPAIDPVVLAGVTVLQFIEKVADRAATERALYHLGWKYALDLKLDEGGFQPTALVYFRDRLEEKKVERLIFDGVVKWLMELGVRQVPGSGLSID